MSILLGIARNITRDIYSDVLGIILGMLLGIVLREYYYVTTVDRFSPIFRTFLGEYSYTTIISHGYMFFFQMMSSGGIR